MHAPDEESVECVGSRVRKVAHGAEYFVVRKNRDHEHPRKTSEEGERGDEDDALQQGIAPAWMAQVQQVGGHAANQVDGEATRVEPCPREWLDEGLKRGWGSTHPPDIPHNRHKLDVSDEEGRPEICALAHTDLVAPRLRDAGRNLDDDSDCEESKGDPTDALPQRFRVFWRKESRWRHRCACWGRLARSLRRQGARILFKNPPNDGSDSIRLLSTRCAKVASHPPNFCFPPSSEQ